MPPRNQHITCWVAGFLIVSMIVGIGFLSNINQPPIDQHSFRQCQTGITAYWFDWKNPLQSFFSYETPIFGVPWKYPFEFPLYQAVVSGVSQISGLAIHTAGRLTSLAFFLLTLLPLASLARGLGLGRRFFFLTAVFWLASPLYLYWSRTVMIESTAVFFGFVFLAAMERAVSQRKWHWWLIALLASLACALVKVTTYPTFGLAAAGILVWKRWPADFEGFRQKEVLSRFFLPLMGLFLLGLATMATATAWTRHADSIKFENDVTRGLISKTFQSWIYGTTAQKTDPENWAKLLDRSIPEAIGAIWVLGFLFGVGCFLQGKRLALLVGLLILFFLPFALFTNVHLVHNYYQYANSFWLVLALGLSTSEMSKRVPRFLTGIVLLAILTAQIHTYQERYFPFTRTQTSGALEAANFIAANTKEHESLLVVGDGWSPELAFLSGRRAVYILEWGNPKMVEALFNKIRTSPETVFGAYPASYLVLNESKLKKFYTTELQKVIEQFFIDMRINDSMGTKVAGYEMLKINPGEKGLTIQASQTKKPPIDQGQTQVLFDSLARKTLGSNFDIENRSMGIFLHPGVQKTEAVFDITDKFKSVRLACYITELPPSGLVDSTAGTTSVEIFVDGHSQGRRPVDRFTNQTFSLDLTNAKEMKVVVDCANGSAVWDHFYLGVAK
jgi:hypothetical protein